MDGHSIIDIWTIVQGVFGPIAPIVMLAIMFFALNTRQNKNTSISVTREEFERVREGQEKLRESINALAVQIGEIRGMLKNDH